MIGWQCDNDDDINVRIIFVGLFSNDANGYYENKEGNENYNIARNSIGNNKRIKEKTNVNNNKKEKNIDSNNKIKEKRRPMITITE